MHLSTIELDQVNQILDHNRKMFRIYAHIIQLTKIVLQFLQKVPYVPVLYIIFLPYMVRTAYRNFASLPIPGPSD